MEHAFSTRDSKDTREGPNKDRAHSYDQPTDNPTKIRRRSLNAPVPVPMLYNLQELLRENDTSYDSCLTGQLRAPAEDRSYHSLLHIETAKRGSARNDKTNFLTPKPFSEHLSCSYGPSMSAETDRQRRKTRYFELPTDPFKILDAPGLQDDFYTSLLAWSPQDEIALCLENVVYLYHFASGESRELYEAFSCEAVTSVVFNPEGKRLAIGNLLGQIAIWDVEREREIFSIEEHTDRVACMDWGTNGLLSGSKDKSVLLHDIRVKKTKVNTYKSHTQEIIGLKWSNDGKYFASGGNDNKALVWSPEMTVPIFKINHKAAVRALAWSEKHPGLLATGGGATDRRIRTWNVLRNTLVDERDTGSQVCSLLYSAVTNDFVSLQGHPANEVAIWRASGLKKVCGLQGHTVRPLHMCLSPCGSTLLSASADETMRFWKLTQDSKQDGLSSHVEDLDTSSLAGLSLSGL